MKKSQISGALMILAAVGLYLFANAHSPNMGFGEMLTHLDGWMLNKPVYYGVLILAAVLGVFGAINIVNSFQTTGVKNKS